MFAMLAFLWYVAPTPLAPSPPSVPFDRTMLTSFYGDGFHGRLTASGTRFDKHAMTVAHKKLPFGTRLRLTYPWTGKTVDVTVTDRGPYIGERELDVSEGVARSLGFTERGVVHLWVTELGAD